jgi:hypothetical protein
MGALPGVVATTENKSLISELCQGVVARSREKEKMLAF